MSIDKVYIFTIFPRGQDRANMCLGGLLSLHTPPEKIAFYVGHDHEEFETRKNLCNAAADDGFPQFLKFAETNSSHAVLAQNWSYCQLFRHIQQNNETAMWMHDDCMLRFNFSRYEEITKTIVSEDPAFKCLALGSGTRLIEWDQYPSYAPLLHKGLPRGAGDYCNIITPRFSDWISNSSYLKEGSHQFEVWIINEISMKNKVPDGFYTIPGDLSSRRFDIKSSPSLIHVSEKIKEGHWITQRSRDKE